MLNLEKRALMLRGNESWILPELEYAGRENRDPQHAARYDQKMDAAAAEEIEFLGNLGINQTSTVLEFGTGTGQFALAAASRVRQVVAVDVSPVMLARLEAKLACAGAENVKCTVAGFLTYSHEGPPADLVYSRYALHHLGDFWKALALGRIAGFLRPGGILRLWDVMYSFGLGEAPERIEQWVVTNTSANQEEGWTREELEEHIRDESSTFTWLLEPMIERAGFSIEVAEYSDDQMSAKYVCRKL